MFYTKIYQFSPANSLFSLIRRIKPYKTYLTFNRLNQENIYLCIMFMNIHFQIFLFPRLILDLISTRGWSKSTLIVDSADIFPRNITAATDTIPSVNLM